MSYEKKIRELMDRLAAMSPEPPPYPEETPLARPKTRKAPRPALVFAAAALLVAVLAVPLLLFTGDGEGPIGTGSTPTTVLPNISTGIPFQVWSQTVYLVQSPEDSSLGNPALVPIRLEVIDQNRDLTFEDPFTAALAALGEDLPSSLFNAIPPTAQIVSLSRDESDDGSLMWVADMNETFPNAANGLMADMAMLNQLIYTITTEDIDQVLFTVNGQPVESFGGIVDLTEPVGRDSFLDQLHVINLTSPITQQEDGTYLVEGIANVFEATVGIAVLDGEGEVVNEEFVTATCGTGCWGEFSTGIDSSLIVPGESSVMIYTRSARDGSIVEAITVPIPENGTWKVIIED